MDLFNKRQKSSNDGKEAWESALFEWRHCIILIDVVITGVYIYQDLKRVHFVFFVNKLYLNKIEL